MPCWTRKRATLLTTTLTISLSLVFAANVQAAEPGSSTTEPNAQKIQEMTVVESPIIEGNKVNSLGSQITVVSERQISDMNAQDLPSALRRTPGVVISRHNPIGSFGGGAGGAVFIRGMGSGRPGQDIQTLLDGVPVFVSVWTHSLMDVLSVDNVQSIEVYKGAQPVLFGNMSFGAVNLISKRKTSPGYTTRFKLAGGSWNTLVQTAEHGGKVDKFDYYAIQSYRYSDGHREDSGGSLQNYMARLGYELGSHWDINLLLNYTSNWADDPGPQGQPELKEGRFKTRDRISILTLKNKYGGGEGYIKAYWDQGHIDWQEQADGSDTRTDYDNYGLRLRQIVRPWSGGELTMGWDQDYVSGKARVISGQSENYHGRETFRLAQPYAALSHEAALGAWTLIPSAGARWFEHSAFSDNLGYQFGLIARHGPTELHASFAHSYNYPGVYVVQQSELFWKGNTLWKDLKPEEVDHFELGISHQFNSLVKAGLTLFHDKGENRLVFTPPPPSPPHWENVGSFENQGVEVTLNLQPLPALALFFGLTYLDADPPDLPYAPEWSGSMGLNYRLPWGSQLSMDALYVDEQYVTDARWPGQRQKVDAFWVVNAKLSHPFMINGTELTVFVAGENLLDQDYQYKKDYPMPGISGMLGVECSF
jgi:outer membrane cobalamin receptor